MVGEELVWPRGYLDGGEIGMAMYPNATGERYGEGITFGPVFRVSRGHSCE